MAILVKNIKALVSTPADENALKSRVSGVDMAVLNCVEDSWLLLEGALIKDFGRMSDFENYKPQTLNLKLQIIDASEKFVFPSWCDSHTHIIYAASREKEFTDRVKGLSYNEIAQRGGGILNSARYIHEATEDDLAESALARLNEIMMMGTGAVEIKSGYGLSTEDELKMLRVIKKLKALSPLTIKATFLGAHAVPEAYKGNKQKYIDLVINEMIPRIADEKLADYCDVFCEEGYFTKEETIKILLAAFDKGIIGKVHAEQLSHSGGIEAGVECNAISVDHLEYANDSDIEKLKNSSTVPTILPGAQFFLQLPHPPARKMIDAGLPVAIASDYNPGSCPSGNMNLMVSLACLQYKMLPEEAINAATINSAYAMGLGKSHGSIAKGKKANIFITKEMPSIAYLPYSFGSNLIETVIVNGEIQKN